jgi:hypothetical protein
MIKYKNKGDNYRLKLLANSHPSFVLTLSSQNSDPVFSGLLSFILVAFVPVSSILTDTPFFSHYGLELLCRSDIGAMVL